MRKLIVSKAAVSYVKENSNVIQILAKVINLHYDMQHNVLSSNSKHDHNYTKSKLWIKYQNFIDNQGFMNDILKVFEILCHKSGSNCEFIAHYCSLTIFKFIRVNISNYNPKYLIGAISLLAHLSLHEGASKYLIRRDVCGQILKYIELLLESLVGNSLSSLSTRDGVIHLMDATMSDIIGKLIRCLTNLVFTNNRAVGLLTDLDARNIISQCLGTAENGIHKKSKHIRALRKEIEAFLTAMNVKKGTNPSETQSQEM